MSPASFGTAAGKKCSSLSVSRLKVAIRGPGMTSGRQKGGHVFIGFSLLTNTFFDIPGLESGESFARDSGQLQAFPRKLLGTAHFGALAKVLRDLVSSMYAVSQTFFSYTILPACKPLEVWFHIIPATCHLSGKPRKVGGDISFMKKSI